MRFPENLKKGGTIGFVAPSFGCTTEPYKSAFANAQKKWKEMGYQLDLGPNCYAEHGIGISAAPEECGKELTEYYVSEKNDCLISCGGGELMCEDLDYVDFEKIRKAPEKWYLGYSDNTHFTYLLPTICDTAAVYGPCASDFGMEPWHKSVADAFGVLTGEVRTVRGYEGWERDDAKAEARKIRICRTRLQNRAFCAASRMRTVHLRDDSSAAVSTVSSIFLERSTTERLILWKNIKRTVLSGFWKRAI